MLHYSCSISTDWQHCIYLYCKCLNSNVLLLFADALDELTDGLQLKYDHIKHVLLDRLHWLPVPQRVQFKLCLLTFTHRRTSPIYASQLRQSEANRGCVLPPAVTWLLVQRSPGTYSDLLRRSVIRRSRSYRLESAHGGCTFDGVGQLFSNCSEDVSVPSLNGLSTDWSPDTSALVSCLRRVRNCLRSAITA